MKNSKIGLASFITSPSFAVGQYELLALAVGQYSRVLSIEVFIRMIREGVNLGILLRPAKQNHFCRTFYRKWVF